MNTIIITIVGRPPPSQDMAPSVIYLDQVEQVYQAPRI